MRYFVIFYCFKDKMIGYGMHFMESEKFPCLPNLDIGTEQEIMITGVHEFRNEADFKSAKG
jgi:hypothetical protein